MSCSQAEMALRLQVDGLSAHPASQLAHAHFAESLNEIGDEENECRSRQEKLYERKFDDVGCEEGTDCLDHLFVLSLTIEIGDVETETDEDAEDGDQRDAETHAAILAFP